MVENEPTYNALYEIESPEVLVSEAWGNAVDQGRWPGQVRPYTKNRRHVLYSRLVPGPWGRRLAIGLISTRRSALRDCDF